MLELATTFFGAFLPAVDVYLLVDKEARRRT